MGKQKSKVELLYEVASKDYNLGTLQEFESKLQDDGKRKALFDAIGKDYNLGTFEDFTSKVKKKDLSQSGSPSGFAPSQSIKPGTSVFPQQQFSVKEQAQPMPVEERYKAPRAEGGALELAKYNYNKALTGIGGMASGFTDAISQIMVQILPEEALGGKTQEEAIKNIRTEVLPSVRTGTQKLAGAKQEAVEKKRYDDNFITGAIGGAIESLPAMASPYGIGFFAQAYDGGLQSINNSKIADQLTETEKTAFAGSVGAVGALIEKYGMDKVFGPQSKMINEFSEKVALKVLDRFAKEGVENVTPKMFNEAASQIVAEAAKRVTKAGGNIARAGGIEGVTGGLQETANITAEGVFNQYKDKQVFDSQSWGEMFGRVAKAAGQEAIGGAALRGGFDAIRGTADVISGNFTPKTIREIAIAGTPEQVEQVVTALDEQLQQGKITPEEHAQSMSVLESSAEIDATIPQNLTGEARVEANELIAMRNDVDAESARISQEMEATDPAFRGSYEGRIAEQEGTKAVLNDAIAGLTTPIVYRQVEGGFQKESNGRVEDITEAQFNYAKDNGFTGIKIEEQGGAVAEQAGAVEEQGGAVDIEAIDNRLADIETELQDPDITEERIQELNQEKENLNATKESSQQVIQGGEQGNQLQREGTQEGQPQIGQGEGSIGETTQSETDTSDSDNQGQGEVSLRTGIFYSEPSPDGSVKYFRKKDAFSDPEEISEEQYNLDTGTTSVYNEDGTPNLDAIPNNPNTGLTDEQWENVKQVYTNRLIQSNGNIISALAAANAKANSISNARISPQQRNAIAQGLRPFASQYSSQARQMQNPSLAQIEKNRQIQVDSYENRKLSWWDQFMKAFFEAEQLVVKSMKEAFEGEGIRKLLEASYKNITKFTGPAHVVVNRVTKDIWGGLSGKPVFKLEDGTPVSLKKLFDQYIQMDRIIEINKMMKEKFDRLTFLDNEIKNNANLLTPNQLQAYKDEFNETKKYLTDRGVLRVVPTGFELQPYEAGSSLDVQGAQANIDYIENEIGPENFKDFQRRKQIYSDTYRALIEELLLEGIISQEQYDQMSKFNYAPTMHLDKLIDEELSIAGGNRSGSSASGIKALKGGSETVLSDAYEAQLIEDINRTYRKIFVNRAAQKLMEASQLEPSNTLVQMAEVEVDRKTGQPKKDKYGNLVYKPAPSGYVHIPVFQDGKLFKLQVPQEFGEMFKYGATPMLKMDDQGWGKKLQMILGVQFMRNLITGINPSFGMYQVVMDAPQAMIATDVFGPSFLLSSAKLIKEVNAVKADVIKGTGWYEKAMKAGALQSFTKSESSKVAKTKSIWGKNVDPLQKNMWEKMVSRGEAFNEKFEHLTRTAVFKAAYDKIKSKNPSMSDVDISTLAANEANKVADYSRGGDITKMLSNFIPYLNAQMQVFKSSLEGYVKNPAKFGAHAIELMGLTAIAQAWTLGLMDDDDEEKKKRKELYLALPQKVRNENIILYNPYADDPELRFIKLPIPNLLQPLHIAVVENMLSENGIKEFEPKNITNSFMDLSPVDKSIITATPAVNAAIRYYGNKNLYTVRDIVEPRFEKENYDWVEGLDDPYVSDIYKNIAKASSSVSEEGVSAPRLQAVMEAYGIKETNPFVTIPKVAIESAMALAQDKPVEVVKDLQTDPLKEVFNMSGFKGRIFQRESKTDAELKEAMIKRIKDRNLEESKKDNEYQKVFKEKGERALRDYIRKNEPELEASEVMGVITKYTKKELLLNRPNWYRELLYARSPEDKAFVFKYYTDKKSPQQIREIKKDLMRNFISPESEIWENLK